MASLSQVANRAGVSISTASVVLNPGTKPKYVSDDVRTRVVQAASALGYVPNYHARSMRLGRALTIGVALDDPSARLGSPCVAALVGAIEAVASAAELSTLIVGADPDGSDDAASNRALRALEERRIDGLIVLGSVYQNAPHPPLSVASDRPVVVVDYPHPSPLPVIEWDEVRGVGLAIEHLTALGHRDLIWFSPASNAALDARGRRALHAMGAAAGQGARCRLETFPPPDSNHRDNFLAGDAAIAAAAQTAMARLLAMSPRLGHATAIACHSDTTAAGVCRALLAAGLTPGREVSVIGIDDVYAPLLTPRLTSVSQGLERIGRQAAEVLLQWIDDPAAGQRLRGVRQLIAPTLTIRETTGPLQGD